MVSLKDRMMLIEFFEFPLNINFEGASIGLKFIETNRIILDGFKEYGIDCSARTITRFCYRTLKPLWKDKYKVKIPDKDISVSIPTDNELDDDEIDESPNEKQEVRESIIIQSLLAQIGSEMDMRIWIPKADRARVQKHWSKSEGVLLDSLPLNYNNAVMKTIENIDVLWLKGISILRAFEVEHTTSIYSGILRMADLLALLPNIDIKLHIVAPLTRREKVFEEIQRPIFSIFERRALRDLCTFISYDKVRELSEEKHLSYLSDGVIEEFEEAVE